MESADPGLAPNQLEDWWNSGLRVIGPSHFGPGRAVTPAAQDAISDWRSVARTCSGKWIGWTSCWTSDEVFWLALEHYHEHVLASHANCPALVPHQREFDDSQVHAILQSNGVIGVTLGNWQLQHGWIVGAKNDHLEVTLDRAVDHICQLAGDSRHVAIGSDLDGGVGTDEFPADLDTIADLQRLADCLTARGYAQRSIADILHNN